MPTPATGPLPPVARPLNSPPHDAQAEAALLGSLLYLVPTVPNEVRALLRSADFYCHGHQHVYSAMLSLLDTDPKLNPVTLRAAMEKLGTLAKVGTVDLRGADYLEGLRDAEGQMLNVEHLARRVAEIGRRREALRVCHDLGALLRDPSEDPDASAAWGAAELDGIAERAEGRDIGPTRLAPEWPAPLGPAARYGLAGEILAALEPHSEADPAALLLQFLVGFGNVIGRGPHFVAEADRHHGNLFLVLVGPSAVGGKGTSWGRTKDIFGRLDAGWSKECIRAGLSSGEGLAFHVRDSNGDDEGVAHKRLLVVEGELTAVLRAAGREGSTLSAFMRTAWDTGTLSLLTKNSPHTATGAHVSVIGHVTRDELLRYLDRTEVANGFANRFLWACVRRSKVLPEGGAPWPHAMNELLPRLKTAVDFARGIGQMGRDREARELWAREYPRLIAPRAGLAGAILSRAAPQVGRLALLYALLESSDVVRAPHLAAALEVWRFGEDSARFIFGQTLGDPVADAVLAALNEKWPEGLARTELLSQVLNRNTSATALTLALDSLRTAGLVRSESVRGVAGRPAEMWYAAGRGGRNEGTKRYEAVRRNERNERSAAGRGP